VRRCGADCGPLIVPGFTPAPTHDNDGFFNVRDFGAVGDGTHDDSLAINAANAAAYAAGTTVYFPPGFYLVNATDLDSVAYVTWRGDGNRNSAIVYDDRSVGVHHAGWRDGSVVRANLATIQGLDITRASGTGDVIPLCLDGQDDVMTIVRDCFISGSRCISLAFLPRNIRIENNFFRCDTLAAAAYGVLELPGTTEGFFWSYIRGNTFECGDLSGGLAGGAAVSLGRTAPSNLRGVHVTDNIFKVDNSGGGAAFGVDIEGGTSDYYTVTGNTFETDGVGGGGTWGTTVQDSGGGAHVAIANNI
jgi:Pectate lyase superfamily protein